MRGNFSLKAPQQGIEAVMPLDLRFERRAHADAQPVDFALQISVTKMGVWVSMSRPLQRRYSSFN